jgi:general secretion pathway protein G
MKRSGFTLIELLVVLVIMGILAGAMVPMITANRVQAQQAKAQADLDSIKTASMLYHSDTGTWPPGALVGGLQTGDDFITDVAPVTPGWAGPYLDAWKSDPWGTIAVPQNYRMIWSAAGAGSLTVVTYGADNAAGGTGGNTDFTLIITSDRLK